MEDGLVTLIMVEGFAGGSFGVGMERLFRRLGDVQEVEMACFEL